jgi:hypothetical protein
MDQVRKDERQTRRLNSATTQEQIHAANLQKINQLSKRIDHPEIIANNQMPKVRKAYLHQ